MSPWNSWITRLASAPLGFIAGAVLALMWTGGHAGKSSCRANARAGTAYHASKTVQPEVYRSVSVPVGKGMVFEVEGGLKSILHDEANESVVTITALERDRVRVDGLGAGQATVVVNRLDGGRATYRVQVLGAEYQPYRSPCQKRMGAEHP